MTEHEKRAREILASLDSRMDNKLIVGGRMQSDDYSYNQGVHDCMAQTDESEHEIILALTDAHAAGRREAIAEVLPVIEFYGDENKYFMRKRKVNLQQTTAVFKVHEAESLPTDFETESFECSASLKVDQGKRARALKEKLK